MVEFLIGVDGGGTGTRVRVSDLAGTQVGTGQSGPSALRFGIAPAWAAVEGAVAAAFGAAGMAVPARAQLAIGLGLAGVHDRQWANEFVAHDPGYGALVLETDAYTTLLGAHAGRPGGIVAIGTGSVAEALLADGTRRGVGGWGFPAGDEGSGAWMGLRAISHTEQALDGRATRGALADAVLAFCGGDRDALFNWLAAAGQTEFAQVAPLVLRHADDDGTAHLIRAQASIEAGKLALALDPDGQLPIALCGGLGAALAPYMPAALRARTVAPAGDAVSGALELIRMHLAKAAP